MGIFQKPNAKWNCSEKCVDLKALEQLVRDCMTKRNNQEAGSSSSLAAPAHSNVEADADADADEDEDEDADDEGAEKDYVMLCCRQVYRPAMGALVECSHCLNWFHLRPVGSCPGESITKAKAKQPHYVHTCSLCNKDPSRRVAAV
jgi:hypothetical protein